MNTFTSCSLIKVWRIAAVSGALALAAVVGSAAAKPGDPVVPAAPVASVPALEAAEPAADPAITAAVEEARERYIQSQMDLWLDLFGKQVGENPPMLTLDSTVDRIGIFKGGSEEGDAFTLIALEVTPIPVDDGSLAPFVSAESIRRFKDAQGDAALIFGALKTSQGMRFLLAASSTFIAEDGLRETVLVPLVIRGEVQVCEQPALQANGREAWRPADHEDADGGDVDGQTWGYCRCVLQILKCETYTAGCIAAAPAVALACGPVCVGTVGLGCVVCIIAGAAGAIALCETAYDCWGRADEKNCFPFNP